jgi:hypothetical protein
LPALSSVLPWGMLPERPQFQQRPPDCTCNGDGLVLVRRVPRVAAMPELNTYRCPECGHVETIETNWIAPKAP